MSDRQREANLVGLSIQEAAISKSLDQAERRAENRCPEHDSNNRFWTKVDELLLQQEAILEKIDKCNKETQAKEDIFQDDINKNNLIDSAMGSNVLEELAIDTDNVLNNGEEKSNETNGNGGRKATMKRKRVSERTKSK